MWSRDAAVTPVVEDGSSILLGASDNTINGNEINTIQHDMTRIVVNITNVAAEREGSTSEPQRHGAVSIASHDESLRASGCQKVIVISYSNVYYQTTLGLEP